jgi:hypothetical protein
MLHGVGGERYDAAPGFDIEGARGVLIAVQQGAGGGGGGGVGIMMGASRWPTSCAAGKC